MTRTDQLLPDALSGMDTAPGITDAEILDIWDRINAIGWSPPSIYKALREQLLLFARAVASRTRPSTPAPDEMAEAVTVLKDLIDALNEEARLEIKHQDMLKNPAGHLNESIGASMRALETAMYDSLSAHRVATAFIARHTETKS